MNWVVGNNTLGLIYIKSWWLLLFIWIYIIFDDSLTPYLRVYRYIQMAYQWI